MKEKPSLKLKETTQFPIMVNSKWSKALKKGEKEKERERAKTGKNKIQFLKVKRKTSVYFNCTTTNDGNCRHIGIVQ